MKITVILPISRTEYLDRVLESLENQTYKPNNLIVVFDGYDSHFLNVRNKVVGLNYENVLCVASKDNRAAFTIAERRVHIVNIHNQIKELLGETDWVFSIEDDGILPPDALEKLVADSKKLENVGLVTGVELGRWGIPYVGAWKVDNIFDTNETTSMLSKTSEGGIEEIDACGLYCAFIRADLYKQHKFFTSNGLGPDVNLALFLRQQGCKNYIDWSIHLTHLTYKEGQTIEIPATSQSKVVSLKLLSGSTWKH